MILYDRRQIGVRRKNIFKVKGESTTRAKKNVEHYLFLLQKRIICLLPLPSHLLQNHQINWMCHQLNLSKIKEKYTFFYLVWPEETCQMLALLFARFWILELFYQQIIHIHWISLILFWEQKHTLTFVLVFHIFQVNHKLDIFGVFQPDCLICSLNVSYKARISVNHRLLCKLQSIKEWGKEFWLLSICSMKCKIKWSNCYNWEEVV